MGRKKSSPVKKAVTTTVVKKGDVPPPDDGDVAAAAGPPSSLGGLGRLPLVLAVLAVAAATLGPSLLSSYGGRSIPEAILEPVQEGRREAELDPVPADAASGDTAAPPKFGLAPAACMSYMLDAMLCESVFKTDSSTSPVKSLLCNFLLNDLSMNSLRRVKKSIWRTHWQLLQKCLFNTWPL